jgi:hypothetical protein
MSNKKTRIIKFSWPILHGTISTAVAKCGQKNCRCQVDPKALHGPYYRWTGKLKGKITTRTISAQEANECERWIENYRKLMAELEKILEEASDSAPWTRSDRK